MDLSDRWEARAAEWIAWARAPGHDSYWRFHRDQFLKIVPAPGRRTVDIGCGEGRLTRHLKALGHHVVDAFYVQDQGAKLTDTRKANALKAHLVKALNDDEAAPTGGRPRLQRARASVAR